MKPPALAVTQTYEFGSFRLDMATRVLLRDNRMVPLPPKVLETLVLLIESRGQLVTKEELLRGVWPDTYVEQNSLMHNISVLRKALGTAGDGKPYIETAPRRGYRFVGTVRIGGEPREQHEPAHTARIPRLAAVGGGLLVVLIAAGVVWMQPPASPPLRITPLTSYPGTEAFPAFSPDGRQVAFEWNGEKQDQFDVYVKTIGAEPPLRLTSDPESECDLEWSPDGKWLSFADCEQTDASSPAGMSGLYIIPSSGGPKRRIGYVYNGANPVAWSVDSKAVISAIALGGAADTGLVVRSVETGAELRQLTWPKPGGWDSEPAISPDGRTLAFLRWIGPTLSDIYLLGLDRDLAPQGQPRRVTYENDYLGKPLWTKDGAELLYTAGHDGARGVWRVRARPGATPKQVTALAQAGINLALSRQGKLAYSSRSCDFDIWRAELGGTTRPKPSELIVSTFSDAEPKYSPDGKSIAFQSNRSGFMEIWRTNADGSGATQVTSLRGEAGTPNWSPDGTKIVFDCRLDRNVDVYVANLPSGTVRRLTTDPGDDTVPSWSRDGKWIYFASKRTGRLDIWKKPAQGGVAVQVTEKGAFFPLESVDGKSLYYAKTSQYPTALWRKSFETGQEEQILDPLRYWSYFAVFGDGIYFIPDRGPGEKRAAFQLDFYEFATRNIRPVADVDKWPGVGFTMSPDRRSVLFAPCESHGADLMLVENFR